jgi:hypothetical protein
MAWIKLNSTTPAAPSGARNVHFREEAGHTGLQDDPHPVSAYLEDAGAGDDFIGDGGAGGVHGLVPAPAAGDAAAGKYLKASGGFAVPPPIGGIGSVFDPDHLTLFDDFLGGTEASALGWTKNGGGGGITILPDTQEAPGVAEVIAVTNGYWEFYILGKLNTGGEYLNPTARTFKISARVKNANPTGGEIRFGLFSNRGSADGGWYVDFDVQAAGAAANWFARVYDGTSVTEDTGVQADGSYQLLEIEAQASGAVIFRINGVQVCSGLTTHLPNALLTAAFQAAGNASGMGKIWIDYFRLDLTRW